MERNPFAAPCPTPNVWVRAHGLRTRNCIRDMEKRAPYSRGYSLVFAAVTVVVAAVALVRRDGMVTIAAAILGLYILHLLSLRAVVRESATPSSPRAHEREPKHPDVSSRPAASASGFVNRSANPGPQLSVIACGALDRRMNSSGSLS